MISILQIKEQEPREVWLSTGLDPGNIEGAAQTY